MNSAKHYLLNEMVEATIQTQNFLANIFRSKNKELSHKFVSFLCENLSILDYRIIYDLIAIHGQTDTLLVWSLLNQDFEKAIELCIELKNYNQVFDILTQTRNPQFCRFFPVLFRYNPEKMVDCLIDSSIYIDPTKLLHCLLKYPIPSIRYIEHYVINLKNVNPNIHNLLLYLYANHEHQKLFKFVTAPSIYFDINYAHRLCTSMNHYKALIPICCLMGFYEDALDIALQFELSIFDLPIWEHPKDLESRQKLDFKIAQYLFANHKAEKALQILSLYPLECVLPLLPDSFELNVLHKFFDAYEDEMTRLNQTMQKYIIIANRLRDDLNTNRFIILPSDKKCDCCNNLLISDYQIFGCSHAFHDKCCEKECKLCGPDAIELIAHSLLDGATNREKIEWLIQN